MAVVLTTESHISLEGAYALRFEAAGPDISLTWDPQDAMRPARPSA